MALKILTQRDDGERASKLTFVKLMFFMSRRLNP